MAMLTMAIVRGPTMMVPSQAMNAILFCLGLAMTVFVILPILLQFVGWILRTVFNNPVEWADLRRESPNKIVIKLLGVKISVTITHIMIFVFLAIFMLSLVGYGILRLIPTAE